MGIKPKKITSTQYENLVQEVYQALLDSDCIKNIKVDKNVIIKGNSKAPHQIDIYWEFVLAGTKYKTCVECKMLGRNVEKGDILEFQSKIEDIGNVTGIFVTTNGYQQGAMTYGEYKNIRLILVQPSYSEFLVEDGVVNYEELVVESYNWDANQINGLVRSYKKVHPEYKKLSLTSSDVQRGTKFYDINGSEVCLLENLLEPYRGKNGFFIVDTKGLYIKTQVGLCGLLSFNISVLQTQKTAQNFVLSIEPVYKAIMHDLSNNRSCFLKSDGKEIEIFEHEE